MRIKFLSFLLCLLPICAQAASPEHQHEHGGQIFHAFRLETEMSDGPTGARTAWDLDGWIGGDENKLWLKSEGEAERGDVESAEFWALYSRNIAEFWDAQIGLRHDAESYETTYLTVGFMGLAPYFFETDAHLFISTEGDVSARLREENDFLLTQELIIQPYAELNLAAQDVPEQNLGAGFTDAQIGLQTRYEISRKFAPYVDIHYERKLGETSSLTKRAGEDTNALVLAGGLRLMF